MQETIHIHFISLLLMKHILLLPGKPVVIGRQLMTHWLTPGHQRNILMLSFFRLVASYSYVFCSHGGVWRSPPSLPRWSYGRGRIMTLWGLYQWIILKEIKFLTLIHIYGDISLDNSQIWKIQKLAYSWGQAPLRHNSAVGGIGFFSQTPPWEGKAYSTTWFNNCVLKLQIALSTVNQQMFMRN